MANLSAPTVALPVLELGPGDELTREGTYSGKLFVLERGRLRVERGGIELALLDEPGAIVGDMAVLLGIPHSATVTAIEPTWVRVLDEAMDVLSSNPEFSLHLATLACARLDATSSLLVELSAGCTAEEQALRGRILKIVAGPSPA